MACVKKIDAFLRASVFPILMLVLALQVYACRGMYADGANFFLNLLETGAFPWYDYQRMTNHILVEGPTWLALKLGAHDLLALRYFFSGSELMWPLMVWGCTLWSLRRDMLFWPFVTLLCFVYYGTNFFAIGEYNLCYALVAYCLAMLLRPLPHDKASRISLLAAAALLPMQYAATLFLGSFLFAVVTVKPKQEWNGATPAYRRVLVLLTLASVASALWEITAPRDPGQLTAAHNIAFLIFNKQFWCVLIFIVATAALSMAQKPWLRGALTIVCAAFLMLLILDKTRLYPFYNYAIRAYMSMAFAGLGCGLWWLRYRGMRHAKQLEEPLRLTPAIFSMILFVMLSGFDMDLSLDYADYLETFRTDVNHHSGLVPYEKSGLLFLSADDRFKWGWTYPLMSIMLRDNATKAIILNPRNSKDCQPFDPAANVPNLDAYYRS